MTYSSRTALGVVAVTIAVFTHDAFSAEQASLPQPEHAGNVTYLSGGIGSDQSAAIKRKRSIIGVYPTTL
ncbi:hypothetical protein [Burkholderia vietnamiensis]|uniref:hypothetical protein n=1 Tax=Burkholderia vietnamiensis TaxID=60552 RepID=UPI001CF5EA9F|nr:hypothetical protein [Burkholderia vietnamiensis]MCA8291965.1 hypothetical protein [Burkholderia vietnamiensis]